jgi:phenylalanyl-tRNA synthetase alpha chain
VNDFLSNSLSLPFNKKITGMLDKIKALQEEIIRAEPKSPAELDEMRIKYISKKGIISQLFDEFRN